jgi:hypothetical protein
LTAGFEPSQDLHFSPLAQSTDQGSIWTPGVLPGGLSPVPDSLASSGGNGHLALLTSSGGEVVASTGDLSSWTPVVTTRELASRSSTAACRIGGLTAVAVSPLGADLVGATCARGGAAGLFALDGNGSGTWTAVGPSLGPSAPGPTQVLRLSATTAGLTALVATGSGPSRELFSLSSPTGLSGWTVSAALPTPSARILSSGTTATGGWIVALRQPGGRATASTIAPGGAWTTLAALPSGTSSVVTGPRGSFDALIVHRATLLVDSLVSGRWVRTQSVDVPIQYGSSG